MTDPTTFVPVRRMISDPGYVPASPWIATDASRNYNRRTPFWFQPRGTLAPVQIGVHGLGEPRVPGYTGGSGGGSAPGGNDYAATGRYGSGPGYRTQGPSGRRPQYWNQTDPSNTLPMFRYRTAPMIPGVTYRPGGFAGLSACCAACASGKACTGCLDGIYRVATMGRVAGVGSIENVIAQAQRTTSGYAIPVAIGATIGYLSEKKTGLVVGAIAGAALKWAYGRWVSPIVTPVVETLTPPGVSGWREDIAWNPAMSEQDSAMDRSAFRFLQAIFIVGAATLALKAAKSAGVIGRKRNERKRNPVGARYRIKGYAYELQGKNWRRAKDDSWDTEVVGVEGPMVGRRHIDGSAVVVIRADQADIPGDVGKFYAITVAAANASRV